MPKITDFKIVYGDGVKGEEYGPVRKAEAHITAVLTDVEDPTFAIESVARQAISQVNKMLGKAVKAVEGELHVVEGKSSNDKDKIAVQEATKAKDEKAEVVDKKKPGKEAKPKGKPKEDPAAVEEEPVTEDAAAVIEDTSTDASAVTDDDAGEVSFDLPAEVEGPTEISDADLNSAVQKKNTEISDPAAIKKLIAEYKTDPTKAFQLREIPQDKRQEFLDKLAGLKKAK